MRATIVVFDGGVKPQGGVINFAGGV